MVRDRPVDPITPKGLPPGLYRTPGDLSPAGWEIFSAGVHWPLAVIIEPIVRRNSATMAAYCRRHGVSLAPHGKTTMAPELFHLQLDDGAWAITAATVWQARAMRAAGVPRVLIANEVVTEPEIAWLSEALADPDFEICCYVDSLDGVGLLNRGLAAATPTRRLPVLVEMGVPGGRAGVRTVEEGVSVAAAARDAEHLEVLGTSAFEGIITATDGRTVDDGVNELLTQLHRLTLAIDAIGGFGSTSEVVVSAGGSAHFDRVVAAFEQIELGRPIRRLIRSGNYLTHADGGYDLSSPMGRNPRVAEDEGRLEAAMEVWGAVLSRPEPTRAIVGVGKRDVSSDGSLPVVRGIREPDGSPRPVDAVTVGLDDQHAYLDVPEESETTVGDLVAFGVRHACTTFDKWRAIPMVDEQYRVLRTIHTSF